MAEESVYISQSKMRDGEQIPLPAKLKKALLSSIKDAEGIIRNDKDRETVVVFDKDGVGFFAKQQAGSSVNIETEARKDRERFEGSTLTHNHPNSTSFSMLDIEFACWAKLAEIRITSTLADYVLRRPDGNMSLDWWAIEVKNRMVFVTEEARQRLEKAGVAYMSDEYTERLPHEIWQTLADNGVIEYTRDIRFKRRR